MVSLGTRLVARYLTDIEQNFAFVLQPDCQGKIGVPCIGSVGSVASLVVGNHGGEIRYDSSGRTFDQSMEGSVWPQVVGRGGFVFVV
jgi:hypothetical protein